HTRSKRDWSSDVCSSDLAEDLVSTDAQRVQQGGIQSVQPATGDGSDDRVIASLEPQRAVGEFGGEGGIPAPDVARSQERGQHQVGIGILLLHGTQCLPGGQACRVGTPGAFPRGLGTARTAAARPLPPRLTALVLPIGPSLGAGGVPPAAHWVPSGCWSKHSPPVNRAPRAQSAP